MLRKGETAASILAIQKRNEETVQMRFEALAALQRKLSGRKRLSDDEKLLLSLCHSQHALASASIPSFSIFPISLNTLKKVANSIGEDDGWRSLDAARKYVFQFDVRRAPQPDKAKNSENQLTDLKAELEAAYRTRRLLGSAYVDVLTLARAHAKENSIFDRKLKKHIEMYRGLTGPSIVHSAKSK